MSIVWSRCLFDTPCPLPRCVAPTVAGLYAILRRSWGRTASAYPWGEFALVDLAETENLALSLAARRAMSGAGSTDDLYVAVYPMPDSTAAERAAFVHQLLATAPVARPVGAAVA